MRDAIDIALLLRERTTFALANRGTRGGLRAEDVRFIQKIDTSGTNSTKHPEDAQNAGR